MSKLDKLLQEYCPDGVPFVKIKDYFTRLKGTPITAGKMKEIASEDGEIKIFAGGKTIINAHEADIPKANITTVPAVLVQSRGVIDFVYYDKPFTFKNEMWAYTHEDITTVKYLYYVLSNDVQYFREKASGMGSLPQISTPVTEEYKVPLPALPVQREIVHVLDEFTMLSAELAAELAARKKQYEYYRDVILNSVDAEEKQLGDVCKFIRGPFGGSLKKSCFVDSGYAVYEQQHAIYSNLDIRYYINEEKYQELKRFEVLPGDIIVSCSGTIGKTFIIPVNAPKGIINQALLKLTPSDELDVNYLQYFFENNIENVMNESSRGGGIKNVPSVGELKEIKISVPSVEKQKEIVLLLDNFSSICTDISSGLPAEIEARQKQYEYYRDKLLTFKERQH